MIEGIREIQQRARVLEKNPKEVMEINKFNKSDKRLI
jgi:hypothetical protein